VAQTLAPYVENEFRSIEDTATVVATSTKIKDPAAVEVEILAAVKADLPFVVFSSDVQLG
jgi:hypothetical protein